MRKPIPLLLLSAALAATPTLAQAELRGMQESRFINGTVGAVAGALIGGPIGLIAGAAIGYTVGPEIAGPTATWGQRRTVVRHARRGARRGRGTKVVIDCAVQANQDNPACVQRFAQQQPVYAQPYPVYGQQPGYPQQPVYMAPAQTGYSPMPAQQVAPAMQQQRFYNPRQNPLVPPPNAFAPGAQYSAALSGPNAPGQQGASGAYGGTYSAPAPQGYGYGQIQAAPVPVPR